MTDGTSNLVRTVLRYCPVCSTAIALPASSRLIARCRVITDSGSHVLPLSSKTRYCNTLDPGHRRQFLSTLLTGNQPESAIIITMKAEILRDLSPA